MQDLLIVNLRFLLIQVRLNSVVVLMCAVGVPGGGAAARAAHGGVQQHAGVDGVAGAAHAAAPPAARAAGARAPPPPLHRARHAHEPQVRTLSAPIFCG